MKLKKYNVKAKTIQRTSLIALVYYIYLFSLNNKFYSAISLFLTTPILKPKVVIMKRRSNIHLIFISSPLCYQAVFLGTASFACRWTRTSAERSFSLRTHLQFAEYVPERRRPFCIFLLK